ncbi:MAG: Ig domain-containing protein, partial [Bacteroidaceae bacterium]|nr:Ig domain-containing protein [Bacteroidaceae bacterium]
IGGGGYAACGNITITSDVTSLTAIKGDGAKHSIGAGADGSCGKVTVGGKEGAVSASPFIFPVAVLETGVTLSQTLARLLFGETLTLTATIAPANATNKSVTWSSSDEAVATVNENGVVTAKSAGTAIITVTTAIEKKTATCKVIVYNNSDDYIVDLGTLTEDYTAYDGDILTGTLGANVKISIASGATVTLRDATLNGKGTWAGITCLGDATIVIEGENSVMGFALGHPGIYIPKGKTLTIRGDGSLTASGKNDNSASCGAGIGGGYFMECGNIVIEGGTINATGGRQSAGIGGGAFSGCGNITITSGVTSVTATKGNRCPYSIGGGERGWCGTVTIGGKETGPISQSPYTYKP